VFGLSPVRLVIIAVVALIVLGPDKLPQVARQAGSLWHTLRSLQQRVEDEIREVAPDLPRSSDLVRYARSPVSLLNQLADKAKAEGASGATEDAPDDAATDDAATEFTLDDTAPEVHDPERPPLAWGDPSLN
jgi:sec-independent protein translocase protein TatB